MNNVYLKKEYTNFFKIFFLVLMPHILYSFYKNGIILFTNMDASIYTLFKPIFFVVVLLIMLLIFKFLKIQIKNNYRWLILISFVSIQTNLFLFSIFIFLFLLMETIFKFKNELIMPVLFKLSLSLALFKNYTYLNNYELNHIFNFNVLDILTGKSVGGLYSTNVIFVIISYIVLSLVIHYKRIIPIVASLTFIILFIISFIFNLIPEIPFAYILMFFVFVATFSKTSPYKRKNMIIYSVVLGTLTYISCYLNPFEGPFISIIIVSFIFNRLKLT